MVNVELNKTDVEKGEGIVYSIPATVQYRIAVQKRLNENFVAMCHSAIINGKLFTLHNEISFTFKINDGEIDVIGGWHVGTTDFTFSKEEGDNCEEYIEEYHPGLIEQLKNKLKELKYL